MKIKTYWICKKCGQQVHISSDWCYCELEQYWTDMAAYYQKKAQECLETAKRAKCSVSS